MREPKGDKEMFLAGRIDAKGKAVLDSGTPWADGVLKFSDPNEAFTEEESRFIRERLGEWKAIIEKAKKQE